MAAIVDVQHTSAENVHFHSRQHWCSSVSTTLCIIDYFLCLVFIFKRKAKKDDFCEKVLVKNGYKTDYWMKLSKSEYYFSGDLFVRSAKLQTKKRVFNWFVICEWKKQKWKRYTVNCKRKKETEEVFTDTKQFLCFLSK